MLRCALLIGFLILRCTAFAQIKPPGDSLHGCIVTPDLFARNYPFLWPLPGVVSVSSDLFYDRTEVANVHWREFMAWTRRVYGRKSREYKAVLPDTTVWYTSDTCLHRYGKKYLTDEEYNFYPVVGVSQHQTELFCKWRSDRVFENLLIENGKISRDTLQTKTTHFTIERYFKHELKTFLSEEKFLYYPDYRLPDISERQFTLAYTDSVNRHYLNKCDSKPCKAAVEGYPLFQSDVVVCEKKKGNKCPLKSIQKIYPSETAAAPYNLRGNVNEWLAEPGVAAGGGWSNSRERILQQDTFHVASPNNSTGFRNVASWKKWEK